MQLGGGGNLPQPYSVGHGVHVDQNNLLRRTKVPTESTS